MRNRELFAQNGFYYPLPLKGYGENHAGYFIDGAEDDFAKLIDELENLASCGRYSWAILSSESLFRLDSEEILSKLGALKTFDIRVLFYVRDQAELIQSGMLQKLKGNPSTIEFSPRLSPTRDFSKIVARWEKFSGNRALISRYDRDSFPKRDVLYDFFRVIGFEAFAGLQIPPRDLNDSLTVESGSALSMLAESFEVDSGDWSNLVEAFLLAQRNFTLNKYFLSEAEVEKVRQHYQAGNRALELEYGLAPITGSTACWRDETTAPSSLHPQLLAAALEIYAIPAIGGERSLSKKKLLRILGSGWGRSHPWGVWNHGLESSVCFRVGKVRNRTHYRAVELHFSGRYGKEQKRCSDVTINGQAFSSVDLSDWSTTILMDDLNDIMLIECEIRHDSLDQRRVYGLENVVVNFVPRLQACAPLKGIKS
ncbi:hypothetical protein EY643_00980 [Halioglobus maricola]|uniref:Uncharacterized protein n=2 Tax=Halioglobus maricola TaxID=2601894 RepID=A0A5P9NFI0_9GAMM|nr:hypothetical protein EY643_00980 [Halioglobus maricola]